MELTGRKGALKSARRLVGSVVVALGLVGVSVTSSVPAGATESKSATLIVPAYQYPLKSPSTLQGIWAELAEHRPPGGTGYVIANPSSGPGSGLFFAGSDYSNYLFAIGKVQTEGWTVLGYLPTGYGTRSLSAVEGGVTLWESRYGAGQIGPGKLTTPVTGIFFDTACAGQTWIGSTGGSCASKPPGFRGSPASFFADLTSYVHTHLGGIAVANPGVQPLDTSFLTNPAVDDAVIAFENQYSVYTGTPAPINNRGAVNQVGTIVWDASTLVESLRVIQTAHADGSNLVYVTSENDDDFYCPPGDVYTSSPSACTISVPGYFQAELSHAS